ncbi:hypothetical protein AAH978_12895 [Streptomyces sp. ZYX-F-203]
MEGPRASPARVPARDRGATHVADRVVAKVAARAAGEAVGPLPPGAVRPRATVTVRDDVARVRVHLDLDYPGDLGARCGRVRDRVARRVTALTGLAVRSVDVEVERLVPSARAEAAAGGAR